MTKGANGGQSSKYNREDAIEQMTRANGNAIEKMAKY